MTLLFLVKLLIFVLCILINVAFFTLLERKILGYIQVRKGPNKTGFKGLLQPFSDALKLFTKEVSRPVSGNPVIFLLSPVMSLTVMMALWGVIPMVSSVFELELGAIFLLCCMSLGVYPIFASGWASNSKYSLLGGLRAIAQTISYEISLALILLSMLVMVGGLSLELFNSSSGWLLGLSVPMLAGMWVITCLVETGRSPFDLPEGESELVSGFNTEYSSGAFALFFLGEYGSMLFLSCLTPFIIASGSMMIIFLSALKMIYFFVWVRGTLPRFRYDFLMSLTWKLFLPISLSYFILILALNL